MTLFRLYSYRRELLGIDLVDDQESELSSPEIHSMERVSDLLKNLWRHRRRHNVVHHDRSAGIPLGLAARHLPRTGFVWQPSPRRRSPLSVRLQSFAAQAIEVGTEREAFIPGLTRRSLFAKVSYGSRAGRPSNFPEPRDCRPAKNLQVQVCVLDDGKRNDAACHHVGDVANLGEWLRSRVSRPDPNPLLVVVDAGRRLDDSAAVALLELGVVIAAPDDAPSVRHIDDGVTGIIFSPSALGSTLRDIPHRDRTHLMKMSELSRKRFSEFHGAEAVKRRRLAMHLRVLGLRPRVVRAGRALTLMNVQANQLREQRNLGLDMVLCIDEGPESDSLSSLAIPIVHLGMDRRPEPKQIVSFTGQLRLACRGKNIVVHSHNIPHMIAVRLLKSSGWRVRVVETFHNMHDLLDESRRSRLIRAVLRLTRRAPSQSMFISDLYLQEAISGQLVLEEHSITVGTGIDLRQLATKQATAPSRSATRRELGLPEDARVIVSVARLDPQKRHDLLLEAFDLVSRTNPDVFLLLVGDGPLRSSLETQAVRLGIAEKIIWAGWRTDVPKLLLAADSLVLTSENEGFGRCVVEGLASGLPVVSTRSPGPELILEGAPGSWLVPYDSKSLAAALDESLHGLSPAMTAGNRERSRRFDELSIALKVATQYEASQR